MHYVATCLDRPDGLALRQSTRAIHLAYLAGLGAKLKTAGALLDAQGQSPIGSMLIFDCADLAQAHALLAADPFSIAGLFASVDIKAWRHGAGAPLA